jgi:hypothetical protein
LKEKKKLAPAKAIIPPPDADGYWHYTYVTYHPDTGEWYGGKHSTKNLEDGYLGSGNWVLTHPARHELVTEIVEFFYSEEHAYAAEVSLVGIVAADPLCRNEIDGGNGMTTKRAAALRATPEWQEAMRRVFSDPAWLEKIREARIRQAADPEWQRKVREGVAKRDADPEWHKRCRAALAKLHADPDWRRKAAETLARTMATPEWREKNREVGARNAANPEWQRKLREALKRRDANPANQIKMKQIGLRRRANQELKQKTCEILAAARADPEWRRKQKEGIIRRSADPEWRRNVREGAAKREANRRIAEWAQFFMESYNTFERFPEQPQDELPEVEIAGEARLGAG